MTELVACTACRRHVAVRETACPFCGCAVTRRPQRVVITRIARAAIFSAALSACSEKQAPPPAPAPTPSAPGSGSDDLEKLLDHDERVVEHATPPIDAAVVDAALPVDAAIPVDAGIDPKVVEQKRRREQLRLQRKRELEEQQRQLEMQQRIREMAKPYGAPPARRRVV